MARRKGARVQVEAAAFFQKRARLWPGDRDDHAARRQVEQRSVRSGNDHGSRASSGQPRRSPTSAIAAAPFDIVEPRRPDLRRNEPIGKRRPYGLAVALAAAFDQREREAAPDPRAEIARRNMADHWH